ncbi:CHASE2 domain-containing protein [Massilia antarctica]|uniref:CHASE2 domain-containing protein n=1 Tax=Massilia antarctica TaxID=2765360 RepID=UPI0006BB767D|nr:adenylate/guanylate cyclase domain-containing protein [Massilia sp. H27-R4]MCY0911074.1 adenylate/guanylate cyclase domain-containing protein [Massilia sp. H27-R4]CUI05346.1 Adenylate cyclase [Janthinobacterium sp. CG23_2]CUU29132.1 Adenylate cyclase [Janthinobacterium sp. CG23_2]
MAHLRSFSPSHLLHLSIPLAALLLAVWAQWPRGASALDAADEWLRDRFVAAQAADTPEPRILVVDIDETSLAAHPWPWSRERLAELVETVIGDGARAVALDILQGEPGDPAGDMRLAVLAQQGPLVLAQLFDYEQRPQALRFGRPAGGQAAREAGGAVPAYGYIANHAGLALAPHVGNIGVRPDPDGVLRRVPMYTWFEQRRFPTLSRALLDCCAATAAAVPDSGDGYQRVPFSRSLDAYTVAKAGQILDGKVDPAMVAGRLVLIGSSSLSIGDRVATPLGRSSPGLLVHASMLTTLLDRQAGLAPAPWPGRLMAVLFSSAVAALAGYTFARLSAAVNVLMLAAAALTWLMLAYGLSAHDPGFSVSGPLLSLGFLLAVGVPFHWQLAQSGSRRLLDTMRRYVAGEVVDELLRSGLKDPLAPRLLQVTTLIADMQGYTSQVEALAVEEAAKLTTDFLDCLTRPVLEKQGTLDKYTGDGLVAFWGAPIPNEQHADLALDAAASILREVAILSAIRVRAGGQPLRVRIGIESGLAMVGDYGTSFRSIYTAVGDSVNTASRLEQAARDFPHDVIIGQGTVGYARRHRFLSLGRHALRGKEHPIDLYTLEALA